eukprot:358837-Chlamydomonas_euryale.AAC.4
MTHDTLPLERGQAPRCGPCLRAGVSPYLVSAQAPQNAWLGQQAAWLLGPMLLHCCVDRRRQLPSSASKALTAASRSATQLALPQLSAWSGNTAACPAAAAALAAPAGPASSGVDGQPFCPLTELTTGGLTPLAPSSPAVAARAREPWRNQPPQSWTERGSETRATAGCAASSRAGRHESRWGGSRRPAVRTVGAVGGKLPAGSTERIPGAQRGDHARMHASARMPGRLAVRCGRSVGGLVAIRGRCRGRGGGLGGHLSCTSCMELAAPCKPALLPPPILL